MTHGSIQRDTASLPTRPVIARKRREANSPRAPEGTTMPNIRSIIRHLGRSHEVHLHPVHDALAAGEELGVSMLSSTSSPSRPGRTPSCRREGLIDAPRVDLDPAIRVRLAHHLRTGHLLQLPSADDRAALRPRRVISIDSWT